MELLIGAVAIVVLIGGVVAVVLGRRNAPSIDERLETLDAEEEFDLFAETGEGDEQDSDRDQRSVLTESRRLLDPLNDFLAERSIGQNMRKKLARANVKLTVAEYAGAHFVSAGLAFTIGYVFIVPGDLIISLVLGVIGLFLPRIIVNRMVNKRLRDFETQLPDTLGLWVNALRSGYSVLQAMEAIANDAPEPTMTEFHRVVREVQLGIDMEDALDHLLERMESEDMDLVVTAVNIQREVGGNLAEILDVISETIRERIKLKGEIRVLVSQGKYTAYFISFLPVGIVGFLSLIQPGFIDPLFTNPSCGWPLLAIGLTLIGLGSAAIFKIVDIEI